MYMENRFKMLTKSKPEDAKRFLQEAKQEVTTRWSMYEYMAARKAAKGKVTAHLCKRKSYAKTSVGNRKGEDDNVGGQARK